MQFKFDSLKLTFDAERADGLWLTAFLGCCAATMQLLQEWDKCGRTMTRIVRDTPEGGEPPEAFMDAAKRMAEAQSGMQQALAAYTNLLSLRMDPDGAAQDPMIGADSVMVPGPTTPQ